MAAMFKAQTANWEETQEKMSQSVSAIRVDFFSIVDRILIVKWWPRILVHSLIAVLPAFIPILVEQASVAEGDLSMRITMLIDLSLRVMFAIDVAKKVCIFIFESSVQNPQDLQAIGSRIVQQTTIVNLITGPVLSVRLVFQEASSKRWRIRQLESLVRE